MTIEEAYWFVCNEIKPNYDIREAGQIVEILFADKYEITNWKKSGDWEDVKSLEEDVERLINNEPIQYVTEVAHFYGRKFKVNSKVLIPRPETEELVYNILKQVKTSNKQYDILDIGTGSGCIPITLKKEKSSLRLFAMDYSQDVLNLAKINARKLDAQIGFYRFDFLNESYWEEMGKFDIIVSNPPYIAEEERSLMSGGVLKYEPERALFAVGEDPLIFYRKIAVFAEDHLNEDCFVFLELNQYYSEAIENVYKEKGYETEIIKDLQGNDRILKARRI